MTPRGYYALFMVLAAGIFILSRRLMPRSPAVQRLAWDQRLALVLAAFVGGAFGAKLPFVIAAAFGSVANASGSFSFWSWDSWVGDGKTIMSGLAGGYLAVEITKLVLRIRVKTGDGFAFPLAAAMAVGRWGCFFYGCCFGTETDLPWAVTFHDGVPRHPTQIYESLFHGLMAVVLFHLTISGRLRNQLLKLYLIAYCGYRFLTEFIRPEPELFAGLTAYQWGAMLMASLLAVQWAYDSRRCSGAN